MSITMFVNTVLACSPRVDEFKEVHAESKARNLKTKPEMAMTGPMTIMNQTQTTMLNSTKIPCHAKSDVMNDKEKRERPPQPWI